MRVGSRGDSGRGGGSGDRGRMGGGSGDRGTMGGGRGTRGGGRGGCKNQCTMTTCTNRKIKWPYMGICINELTWWAEHQRAGDVATGRTKAARKQERRIR